MELADIITDNIVVMSLLAVPTFKYDSRCLKQQNYSLNYYCKINHCDSN